MAKVTVKNAFVNGQSIGKGLFANRDISKGEKVAGMQKTNVKRYNEQQWKQFLRKNKNWAQHDMAIFVVKVNKYVTDYTKATPRRRWYNMNHSSSPNTQMTYEDGAVVWRTIRKVRKNDELTFRYGEGTEEWDSVVPRTRKRRKVDRYT